MKAIFFGTPQFAVPSLEQLLSHPKFEVMGVVTQPDKRRGRGNQLMPSPVKTVATAHQLTVWQPQRIKKDTETLTHLRQVQADVFVVVAYGQILSPEILAMPQLGCINAHGSILPKYRGAAPIQWCLYYGETETGMTTMLMDAGMDTGDMLLKAHTPISLVDNAQDLAQTLSAVGADLLVETLLKLQRQEIAPIPQDSSQATYAPLIKKQDYVLNWERKAVELHNQVRGFFPDCVTTFRDTTLKISATVPLGITVEELPIDQLRELKILETNLPALSASSARPGEVVSLVKGLGPIVQTGEGFLLLREVQLSGKRTQNGWDFANGTRLTLGEVLDSAKLTEVST